MPTITLLTIKCDFAFFRSSAQKVLNLQKFQTSLVLLLELTLPASVVRLKARKEIGSFNALIMYHLFAYTSILTYSNTELHFKTYICTCIFCLHICTCIFSLHICNCFYVKNICLCLFLIYELTGHK